MAAFDFPPPLVEGHQHRGAGVFDGDGKRIGTIDRVFTEPSSACEVYADLTCGGILGFGVRHHVIPWDKLHADAALGGFRIDDAEVEELRRGDKPGVSSGRLLHGRW